jgi:hypothetical protein
MSRRNPRCSYHVHQAMRKQEQNMPIWVTVTTQAKNDKRTIFRCPVIGCPCVKSGDRKVSATQNDIESISVLDRIEE